MHNIMCICRAFVWPSVQSHQSYDSQYDQGWGYNVLLWPLGPFAASAAAAAAAAAFVSVSCHAYTYIEQLHSRVSEKEAGKPLCARVPILYGSNRRQVY